MNQRWCGNGLPALELEADINESAFETSAVHTIVAAFVHVVKGTGLWADVSWVRVWDDAMRAGAYGVASAQPRTLSAVSLVQLRFTGLGCEAQRACPIFLHTSHSSDLFHLANGMIIFPLSLFRQTLHSKWDRQMCAAVLQPSAAIGSFSPRLAGQARTSSLVVGRRGAASQHTHCGGWFPNVAGKHTRPWRNAASMRYQGVPSWIHLLRDRQGMSFELVSEVDGNLVICTGGVMSRRKTVMAIVILIKPRINRLIDKFSSGRGKMFPSRSQRVSCLQTDFLEAIANTTQSLLKNIETVKKNKRTCIELMEQTHELLNAIIILHVNSDTSGVLPPSTLNHIGKFTETLHKIHTFVEAHQSSSKVKQFFRQGEISTLLKDCKNGLTQGLDFFRVVAKQRHQEVLAMIDGLSDSASSARASTMSRVYSQSQNSKVELAALIGAHLGLKPGKDLTQAVCQYFTNGPPSLLVLDNLETVWEPMKCCGDIEQFLSLLTDVRHLALVITMRGAERPSKVHWTRPFLAPLQPLEQAAARQTLIDIAEDHHNPEDMDRVLSLTDNMPLAINLIAHLVDVEGCSSVLSRWEEEKTSLISDGYDKRSNFDLSISLSLSSPRIQAVPHSKELLSLLAILPDGLSDLELVQSKLQIDDVLDCKTALIRTALAYRDEKKQLKALVPIREYMKKTHQPGNDLIRPLLKYFKELLELYKEFNASQMSSSAAQILSNFANIQNILQNGLQPNHPDLKDTMLCALNLNLFSRVMGQGTISFLEQLHHVLPDPCDHQLEAALITELFISSHLSPISNPETLVAQASEHFEHFDDPDLKCKFYHSVANHYLKHNQRLSIAMDLCHKTISLATSSGNTKRHSQALHQLAWIHWSLGDYLAGQDHAQEAQRLARISADLFAEANALCIEAVAWTKLGNYKQSISLCTRARDLLALCGMSSGNTDHDIMNHQAEIHLLKSEYHEAYNIQTQILQESPLHLDSYHHGVASLNLAELGLSMSAPKHAVQQDIERVKKILLPLEQIRELTFCDILMADLYLREGDIPAAEALFKQCLAAWSHSEIKSFCLERLGNTGRWGASGQMSNWTTVYLAHSLKFKEKLGIHKALQFLGDIFLAQADEDTAVSLFTIALKGFTYMDVHRSRAECMLRLGDIAKEHDDLCKAVDFWDAARLLFARSSQAKQVELIDERLASVGKDLGSNIEGI
ncbi:hypothetical protein B0H13DRAFT_2506841 [Mycena leptocephala]|nr:hypothetical protein B0H13DRAFT_2506841 [Mycena leptocephala]